MACKRWLSAPTELQKQKVQQKKTYNESFAAPFEFCSLVPKET